MSPAPLTTEQLDALCEVASMGAGHAATALSTMTGRAIIINVPTLTLARLADVPGHVVSDATTPVAVVLLRVRGDFTGRESCVSDGMDCAATPPPAHYSSSLQRLHAASRS